MKMYRLLGHAPASTFELMLACMSCIPMVVVSLNERTIEGLSMLVCSLSIFLSKASNSYVLSKDSVMAYYMPGIVGSFPLSDPGNDMHALSFNVKVDESVDPGR